MSRCVREEARLSLSVTFFIMCFVAFSSFFVITLCQLTWVNSDACLNKWSLQEGDDNEVWKCLLNTGTNILLNIEKNHMYIEQYWNYLEATSGDVVCFLLGLIFFLLILLSTVNPHSNTLPLVKLFKANPLCPYGQCNSSVVSTRFECRPEWDPSVCMFSLYWHWLILPGPRLAGWSWSPDTLWWLLIAPNSVNEFPYGDQQRISYPPSTQPAFLCNLCS